MIAARQVARQKKRHTLTGSEGKFAITGLKEDRLEAALTGIVQRCC